MSKRKEHGQAMMHTNIGWFAVYSTASFSEAVFRLTMLYKPYAYVFFLCFVFFFFFADIDRHSENYIVLNFSATEESVSIAQLVEPPQYIKTTWDRILQREAFLGQIFLQDARATIDNMLVFWKMGSTRTSAGALYLPPQLLQ
jgi:hypothetical protein